MSFFEAVILNFLSQPFGFFLCFISVKKAARFYEVSCFLHCGCFLQNLGKEAVRTFMHTTVYGTVAKKHILKLQKYTSNIYEAHL